MRALLVIAASALALQPFASAFAAGDDDGPIATAPEAGRAPTTPPPPDSASALTPPQQLPPPALPPASSPPPPAYATASPPPPPATPPPAEAFAQPPPATPPAAEAGATVVYEPGGRSPPFMAITPGRDALAGPLSVVGAVAAIDLEKSDGAKLISANGIADPAAAVGARLAEVLAPARGAGRYVVKVETRNWGFTYYLLDWSHYYLVYAAHAELRDARSHRLLAQADCTHKADGASERYALDELTGNGATVLKARLAAVADACAASLAAKMGKG